MVLHPLQSQLKSAIEEIQADSMAVPLTAANPAFAALAFYSALCILKMFFVTLRIVYLRLTRHVYSTNEDVKGYSNNPKGRPIFDDTEVERVRRSLQNDLENIPIFIFLGLFLVATGSGYENAVMHFRVFTVVRFLFSFCHLILFLSPSPLLTLKYATPAPSRSVCFVIGTFVNISMAVQVVMATI